MCTHSRRPVAARSLELVRAHVHERRGVAVVGVLEHDHVVAAGRRAREPQRELVRLAARVDEVADAERLRQQPRQPPRVAHGQVVQVAGVGVEERELLLHRAHHARVAVAHERHVVVDVEVGAPRVVVEVLAEAAHDLERPRVGEPQARSEQAPARGERLVGARVRPGSLERDPQQQVRDPARAPRRAAAGSAARRRGSRRPARGDRGSPGSAGAAASRRCRAGRRRARSPRPFATACPTSSRASVVSLRWP